MQGAYGSSQMFSEGLDSFSTTNGHFSQQEESCIASQNADSSGFQGLDEALLDHDEIGEGPSLLGDELLPQLEAFVQEETSNRSWANAGHDEKTQEEAVEDEEEEDMDFEHSLPCYESQVRSTEVQYMVLTQLLLLGENKQGLMKGQGQAFLGKKCFRFTAMWRSVNLS